MNAIRDFKELAADPPAFREAILIDADGQPRRLGNCLDDWQRRDFEAIDSGLRKVVGQTVENPTLRAMFIRPRGHSKSSDQAVSASWLLFAARRKLNGIAAAADKDQAALLLNAIDSLCRLNGWLGSILEVGRDRVTNRHTGSSMVVISSDAASSFGHNPDFVILDELTHWRSRELFDSLLSAAAKRASCLLLCIANAGFRESWQGQLVDQIRVDTAWHFRELDGPKASWITGDRLEEQRRLLPAKVFARLWLNQWADGAGDALESADIDAAVTLGSAAAAGERGWQYVAGLDIGLSRDASALVVVGKHVGHVDRVVRPPKRMQSTFAALQDLGFFDAPRERIEYRHAAATGKLRVAAVRIWTPQTGRVELEGIEQEILQLHSQFKLGRVAFDPWQAEYLMQRLAKKNIFTEQTNFSPSNLQSMAAATLDAFRERQIELFPHSELLADLRGMRVVEKSYGYRLEAGKASEGTAHGDAATALAIALHAARSIRTESALCGNRQLVYN